MSNHLAIATVTATIRQVLHNAVTQDVSGATVEAFPLGDSRLRDSQAILNVHLYHITPNPAWRNEELPSRRADGTIARRPQLALNLYYLLTAFGRSTQADPEAHRLLGSAVRALHERPVLRRSDITSVVQAQTSLAGSNLADQVELVRLTPQGLSLEEMSKLWSVFFQTPYRISASYEASLVLIDGESSAEPSLPAQARNIYVVTLRSPVIHSVTAASGEFDPILAGDEVLISGANLRGDTTHILIDGVDVAADPADVTDGRITLSLPSAILAGVQGVQVVHRLLMGTPEVEHIGPESNVAAFVLRPRIQRNAADTAWEIPVNVTSGSGSQPRSGELTVVLEPEVGRDQRVVLFLNEFDAPPGERPRAYSFEAPSRADDVAEATETVAFDFSGVVAASYLVRIQVNGAESPLQMGGGGLYDEPRVSVP